jgi:hypothetical protein
MPAVTGTQLKRANNARTCFAAVPDFTILARLRIFMKQVMSIIINRDQLYRNRRSPTSDYLNIAIFPQKIFPNGLTT